LLLQAALTQGRWDIVGIILLGGLLAAGYIFKVLGNTFTQAPITHEPVSVSARMQWAAMLLAIGAILVGFLTSPFLALVGVGDPFNVGGLRP
jgi:NADH:ubiquinone oxidoreductase subunit 2 (subunit N)